MLILLLLSCCIPTFAWQELHKTKFREDENAGEAPARLLSLMRSLYEDASQRITETNPMRFMYEESPHYETGYVFHELIERYKKMVEEMNRLVNFKTNTIYDNVERTEMMQKLYFEVYHLANMIHEISRKWKGVAEFLEKKGGDFTEIIMNREVMAAFEERKRREIREKKKMLKKRREMLEKGLLVFTERPKSAKRVPYNKHWPLDYGWEIDWW